MNLSFSPLINRIQPVERKKLFRFANRLARFFSLDFSCYSEKSPSEFVTLPCRHLHCLTCWQHYLESAIILTGSAQPVSCPSRCNQIIDDEQILKLLVNNDKLRQRYQRFLIDTFVQTNRLTCWCPGNGCTMIVKMKSYASNRAQMIECDNCKTIFCFQCSRQWHAPIQCSLLQKWEQKNQDESMTGKWILASIDENEARLIDEMKIFRYERMS